MEKGYADGISRIEINSLWGRKHIVWNLRPDVNILSGVNGTGKSTILNKTVARYHACGLSAGADEFPRFNKAVGIEKRFYPFSRLAFGKSLLHFSQCFSCHFGLSSCINEGRPSKFAIVYYTTTQKKKQVFFDNIFKRVP